MKRSALLTILISLLAIAAGYASAFLPNGAPPAATFAFALGTAAVMVGVLMLGAAHGNKRVAGLQWIFGFCFVVLAAGFSAALRADTVTPDSDLWLGLPAGAATILYVVGLLPLMVLPLAYALWFDRVTLSDAELAELRLRLQQLRERTEQDVPGGHESEERPR